MGYLVNYCNPSNNKAIAINRDKIVYIELDREAKCLKIVYGFSSVGVHGLGSINEQCTKFKSDNISELEDMFNLITNEAK